ncbi:MAG: hypothetical protein HY401_08985 [Elusimicrobia bacterium]|nr:hypothetical protein [Elusimicrobiota bacterium]
MPQLNYSRKAQIFLFGIPLCLAVLWSARDIVGLARNIRKIRDLKVLIKDRETKKEAIVEEFELLKKNDPGAWKRVYRQEAHALEPGEIEYRFKPARVESQR